MGHHSMSGPSDQHQRHSPTWPLPGSCLLLLLLPRPGLGVGPGATGTGQAMAC